jgi:hypothetical protein
MNEYHVQEFIKGIMDMTIPQHNNLNAYDLLKVIDIIHDEAKHKFLGEHCTSQVINVIASWATHRLHQMLPCARGRLFFECIPGYVTIELILTALYEEDVWILEEINNSTTNKKS